MTTRTTGPRRPPVGSPTRSLKDAGARPSILAVMEDPALFGRWFAGSSWDAWKAVLRATVGLPLTPEQLETFRAVTGRLTAPTAPARELWAIVGRRGGKSLIVALVAVYLSTFVDYTAYLAPGGGLALPAPQSTLTCASCGRADDGSSGWFVYPSVTCPRCQIRRPDEA